MCYIQRTPFIIGLFIITILVSARLVEAENSDCQSKFSASTSLAETITIYVLYFVYKQKMWPTSLSCDSSSWLLVQKGFFEDQIFGNSLDAHDSFLSE